MRVLGNWIINSIGGSRQVWVAMRSRAQELWQISSGDAAPLLAELEGVEINGLPSLAHPRIELECMKQVPQSFQVW
jgi:hypothetical protein